MNAEFFQNLLPLRECGFALHWLHPKSKRPIGDEWQTKAVPSVDRLRDTYVAGNNVGVRLGEPSHLVNGEYLHVIDVDVRDADQVADVLESLGDLLPAWETMPRVRSGSGGESFHIYFTSSAPFNGRKLALSEGKHRDSEGKWHYDWEIDLFGTGRQVVLPPSVHPSGGLYQWEVEFPLDDLDFDSPFVPAATVEGWGAAETFQGEFETRPPLEFKPGQLENDLAALPVDRVDDYHDWVLLGQALHHQFGASEEGFDLWVEQSKRSPKFESTNLRDLRRKWRGFGRYRGKPVTMGTIRVWAQEARAAALVDEFDDLDDEPEAESQNDDFDDFIEDSVASDTEFQEDSVSNPAELPWQSLLDFTEDNAIKDTVHNMRLIIENDPRFRQVMAFNEFTQEVVQRGQPGTKPHRARAAKPTLQLGGQVWDLRDPVNGDFWTEGKDNAVRAILEAPKTQGGWGFKVSDRNLRAAIDIVGRKNYFHPVREYLSRLQWDGVPRIERLFCDYLGAPDDAYTRSVGRLMMTAGVARVFEPGIKFDYAVILKGLQGKRKSTFISVLARHWFAELEGDFDDPKQMVEMMQGAWILEMPELGGFVRSDVRHIKAFISRQSDKVRLAYAKRAQEYHRQCIFIGSTNDDKFLKDETGNRRFWVIFCAVDSIDTERLEENVDQLWAEALHNYREMRAAKPCGGLPLYLTDEDAQVIAARLQESARVESADDAMAGTIAAWLEKPVRSGSIDAEGEGKPRNRTCLLQIWVEALGKDAGAYNQQAAQTLGRAMWKLPEWVSHGERDDFPTYGRQRVYWRTGD